jgi:glucosamine kinase
MVPWIFGIDGGGTTSRLRIETPRGDLLFKAEAGGTNLNSNPRRIVAAALESLFAQAYASGLGIVPEACAAGFAASAGIDKAGDSEAFLLLLREVTGLACPLSAGNDAEAALVGSLGDTEGLLLIAGTGSIALGRSRDGERVRAGGWGHILGDEGSAYRISLDAVTRALRAFEGRDEPTVLLNEALSFFGAREPADLLRVFYGEFDKASIARFARVVGRARDDGDRLARELFESAAHELAGLVFSVHERIGSRLQRKRLAIRGGLVEGDAALKSAVERLVAAGIPGIEMSPPLGDAVTGSCALARTIAQR